MMPAIPETVPLDVALFVIVYVLVMLAWLAVGLWALNQPRGEGPLVRFMSRLFDDIRLGLIDLAWRLTKPLHRWLGLKSPSQGVRDWQRETRKKGKHRG